MQLQFNELRLLQQLHKFQRQQILMETLLKPKYSVYRQHATRSKTIAAFQITKRTATTKHIKKVKAISKSTTATTESSK